MILTCWYSAVLLLVNRSTIPSNMSSYLSKSLVDVSNLHEDVSGDKAADVNLALDKVCIYLHLNFYLFIR